MTALLVLLLALIVLMSSAALLVVRSPMHGAVNLGITLLALGILFLVLGAPFVAAPTTFMVTGGGSTVAVYVTASGYAYECRRGGACPP